MDEGTIKMPVNTGNRAEVNPDFPGNEVHSLYSRKPFHGLGEDSVFDIKMQGTLQLKKKGARNKMCGTNRAWGGSWTHIWGLFSTNIYQHLSVDHKISFISQLLQGKRSNN